MNAPEYGAASAGVRLGRLPKKSNLKALMASDFLTFPPPPPATHFFDRRAAFAPRTFGNTTYGDCTRAKQANAIRRMERIEVRRTSSITDEEVIRVYQEMSERRYGGGDNGAFEVDALDDWRNPATTIRDVQGRALTIDAYVALNASDQNQLRGAMAAAKAHGIAICLNLPRAFAAIPADQPWDIPDATPLVGDWLPGSWGGHSMWTFEYDHDPATDRGLLLEHTWDRPPQWLTWRAAAAYLDEAHLVIDSVDYWRTAKLLPSHDLDRLTEAVNDVSAVKIPW
jgi:hypothetical protein